MALVICKECQKEISDRATSCTNCGSPLGNDQIQKDESVVRAVAIISFFVMLASIFIYAIPQESKVTLAKTSESSFIFSIEYVKNKLPR